jgi:hypothetical protein
MVILAADNQWFLRQGIGSTSVTTDPVDLGGFDRATAILVLHDIFGGAVSTDRDVTFKTQVSNDGVHWIDGGPLGGATVVADTPLRSTADVNGAFMRFVITMTMSVGGLGGALLDLKVRLDRK